MLEGAKSEEIRQAEARLMRLRATGMEKSSTIAGCTGSDWLRKLGEYEHGPRTGEDRSTMDERLTMEVHLTG